MEVRIMDRNAAGLMMIPGLISGITGGSYADIVSGAMYKEPGMSPKQYGMMLARKNRGRGQRTKSKKARRRK